MNDLQKKSVSIIINVGEKSLFCVYAQAYKNTVHN